MSNAKDGSEWRAIRSAVLMRDGYRCRACGQTYTGPELDVHHRIPRSMGGPDDLGNLVALCDGCHAALHPNLQASLSRRFIERWAIRLAKWLDEQKQIPDSAEHLGSVLRILGIQRFRENQLDVVLAALRGESLLFISSTGSGKSLCFQIPGLLRRGTTLVISPLKALMSDQVSALTRKMIPSTFINGDLSKEEKLLRYKLLEQNSIKFLFCAPERFDPSMVDTSEINRFKELGPSYLVIDEAHSIERWGHDFRPNYNRLGAIKEFVGNPPVLAFTATAGIKTQKIILSSLRMPDARVFVSGINRPNIAFLRLEAPGTEKRLQIIKELVCAMPPNSKAMIFVPTIRIGEMLQVRLRARGLVIPFYHSKIKNNNERDMILGRFTGRIEPNLSVVICTNAFGMGLDVPNIRLVIHWQHPSSVEEYFQEIGRAGRDGDQSLAVLFTNNKRDKDLPQYMARVNVNHGNSRQSKNPDVLAIRYSAIEDMYSLSATRDRCFRNGLISYFKSNQSDKKTLSIKIVEWLYATKESTQTIKACCDYCDKVTINNYKQWVIRL